MKLRLWALVLLAFLLVRAASAEPSMSTYSETRVVPIRHCRIDVAYQIAKALYPGLECHLDREENLLIVRGSRDDVASLDALVRDLDRPFRNVMVDVRLLSISGDGARALRLRREEYEPAPRGAPKIYPHEIPSYLEQIYWHSFKMVRIEPGILTGMLNGDGVRLIRRSRLLSSFFKSPHVFLGDDVPYAALNLATGRFEGHALYAGVQVGPTARVTRDGYVNVDVSSRLTVYWGGYPVRYYGRAVTDDVYRTRVNNGETLYFVVLKPEMAFERQPLLLSLPVLGEFLGDKRAEYLLLSVTFTILP